MLARNEDVAVTVDNFLSAEALGLFPKQRDGLIKTLELLESGLVNPDDYVKIPELEAEYSFNMNRWFDRYTDRNWCGTVCCIGGTACLLESDQDLFKKFPNPGGMLKVISNMPEALHTLFYGYSHKSNPQIAPERAAQQLRDYLMTGECPYNWADDDE